MVKLIKDYYLTADKRQYIVGRLYERKRGDRTATELIDQTFHPTLAAALVNVMDAVLRDQIEANELKTLDEVGKAYCAIKQELVDKLESAPRQLQRKVNELDR